MGEEVLTEEELSLFTGTIDYHRLTMGSLNCTDGVAHVATKGKAFWLIDAIASYQTNKIREQYPFQKWILEVENEKGLLCMFDTDNNKVIQQKIPYTDFPLKEITFYLTNNVLLLPSEN